MGKWLLKLSGQAYWRARRLVKWISILLALAGVAAALWAVSASKRVAPDLGPDRVPALNPYPQGIAALGVVEARTRNVRLAPPEGGVVSRVPVQVNDRIKAGDVLFELDPRLPQAELARAKASVEVARQQVMRLESMPRKEDLAPLRAAVKRAKARLADAENDRKRVELLRGQNAAAELEWVRSTLAVEVGEAGVAEAQAILDRDLAGAWEPDLVIARAQFQLAQAEAAAAQQRLDRLSVRSPVDGMVLKRFIEPGEFVAAGTMAMQVGDLSSLRIRAQVDERDTQALRPGARGTAIFAGNRQLTFALKMLSIEPMALAKSQLRGLNTELVDTRVVEVVFEAEAAEQGARLYPGQVVDVFIETAGGQ